MADSTNNNDNIKDLSEALQFLPTELSGLTAATKDADLPGLTKAINNANAPELTKALKDLSSSITNESLLKRTIEANTRALNSLTSKIDQLTIQQAQRSQQGAVATGGQQAVQQNNPQLDKIIQLLTALSTNQATDRAQKQAEGGDPNNKPTGFLASLGLFVKGMWLTNKKLEERGLSGNEWARLGHHVGNKMSGGVKTFVGGGLDMIAAGSLLGGATFMGLGFLADQIMKIVSDHILSIPKSWATLKQAQVLTGTFDWNSLSNYRNDNNVRNNNPFITALAGNGADFGAFHMDYRFRAGRMGYASDEFYNRYLDFIGAGVRGPSGGPLSAIEQYLMPALAIEKNTGGQVKFTTDFLAAINKSTSSTFSLEKHIQALTTVVQRNVYVSEKQLQTLTTSLAVGVRGNVGNGNEFYARALAMVAPAMNANLLTEQEAAGLLQASKGLSFDQRAKLAAFIPSLQNKGIIGGAQTLLENSATMQGQTKNLEYFVEMAKAMTGGRKFMSMDGEERGQATLLLTAQGLPTQLAGSAVFGKLVDAIATVEDKKEADELMKDPTLKALEANAQGIAALEDPLKQIRDTVIGWAIDGFNWFRGGKDPSITAASRNFTFIGMDENNQKTYFTRRDYDRADAELQQKYKTEFAKYQNYLVENNMAKEKQSFEAIYSQVKEQEKSNQKLDEVNNTLTRIEHKMMGKSLKESTVAGSDSTSTSVDTTASDPLGM